MASGMIDSTELKSDAPVALVGASGIGTSRLSAMMQRVKTVVAADGGAEIAMQIGVMPDLVIGDFDSLSFAARAALDGHARLVHVACQDTTDFEKALRAIDAPLVIAVGFLGKRLDHELAVLSCLLKYPLRHCMLLGDDDVVFQAPRHFIIDLPTGTRISLIPLRAVQVTATDLRWPLHHAQLAPGRMISTSNEASGPVCISCSGPGLLVILPCDCWQTAANSLMSAGSSTHPARGDGKPRRNQSTNAFSTT